MDGSTRAEGPLRAVQRACRPGSERCSQVPRIDAEDGPPDVKGEARRQEALPLAHLTADRVTGLYGLMDSGYDAAAVRACSEKFGHVPVIDPNPRTRASQQAPGTEARAWRVARHLPAERRRERSSVKRVNGRLEDEFGGRRTHVRDHAKVMTHLMFGICTLSVDQLTRLLH